MGLLDRSAGRTSSLYSKPWSVCIFEDWPFSLYIVAAFESNEGLVYYLCNIIWQTKKVYGTYKVIFSLQFYFSLWSHFNVQKEFNKLCFINISYVKFTKIKNKVFTSKHFQFRHYSFVISIWKNNHLSFNENWKVLFCSKNTFYSHSFCFIDFSLEIIGCSFIYLLG